MALNENVWISHSNAHHIVLDGVPMKIAEIYKSSTKKVSLPANIRFCSSQSRVLNQTYNFEIEQGYMQWYQEFTDDKRRSEEAKHKKKLEKEQETQAAANEVVKTEPQLVAASTTQTTVSVKPPIAISTILTPERAISPSQVKSVSPVTSLNINDFENLAQDPFDNLELKTINDMEELKNVLAQSAMQSVGTNPFIKPCEQNDNSVARDESFTETVKGASTIAFKSAAVYENVELRKSNNPFKNDDHLYGIQHVVAANSDNTEKKAKPSRPPPPMRAPLPSPRSSLVLNEVRQDSQEESPSVTKTDSQPKSTSNSKRPVKAKPAIPTKPKITKTNPGLAASAKIMSLQNLLAKENGEIPIKGAQGFSYTSYGKPVTKAAAIENPKDDVHTIEWPAIDGKSSSCKPIFSHTVNEKSENGSTIANDKIVENPNTANPPDSSTTNSTVQEQAKDRTVLTEQLEAMGYNRTQINAAMRNCKCDMRELVDYLCAIDQVVTEGAVKWPTAQESLLIFKNDYKKAVQYSQAFEKLTEIGFASDKVKDALLKYDLEQNKALEALLNSNAL